jgi:hypothetical protein
VAKINSAKAKEAVWRVTSRVSIAASGSCFPESLDEYIGDENPVRFSDAFVDGLDLRALGLECAVARETGRPPYHPGVLLKLYIILGAQKTVGGASIGSRLPLSLCRAHPFRRSLTGAAIPDGEDSRQFAHLFTQALAGADPLIESPIAAVFGFAAGLWLLGTLFHPWAAQLRSVRQPLLNSSLILEVKNEQTLIC